MDSNHICGYMCISGIRSLLRKAVRSRCRCFDNIVRRSSLPHWRQVEEQTNVVPTN